MMLISQYSHTVNNCNPMLTRFKTVDTTRHMFEENVQTLVCHCDSQSDFKPQLWRM